MIFMDMFGKDIRGEFKIVAKNRKGEVVHEYVDRNVVVNDARPVTAYLLNQAIMTGAQRKEYDLDGISNQTDFLDKLINPQNFQISFIKMGGGFPRKRSFSDSTGEEVSLAPDALVNGGDRNSLWRQIDFGSTATDTVPASWVSYGESTIQQPYHSSSLLYPRKTDIDIVDRDFQWAKRIISYTYNNTPSGDTSTGTIRAVFTTTMRFDEGNGPEFGPWGQKEAEENKLYEYREAALCVGIMPWQYELFNTGGSYYSIIKDYRQDYSGVFGFDDNAGDIDSTLSGNWREYRFWDGQSELMSPVDNGSWANPDLIQWPRHDSDLTWESMIAFRGKFSTITASNLKDPTNLQGDLWKGNYMVARKTFPVITKTTDLEFTISWSLVFG